MMVPLGLLLSLLALACLDVRAEEVQRSIEVNPYHVDGEHIEIQVANATVENFLTLCYRVLHKHFGRVGTETTVFRQVIMSTYVFAVCSGNLLKETTLFNLGLNLGMGLTFT